MVIDPADGKCKPDGTTTSIASKCTMTGTDPACGTALSASCNDEPNDGFPGGYCSFEPCSPAVLCPVGSSCGSLGGEKPACFKICTSDADCRTPDYKCWDIGTFLTSGASKKVCYLADWPCVKSSECPAAAPRCQLDIPDGGLPGGGSAEGTCAI